MAKRKAKPAKSGRSAKGRVSRRRPGDSARVINVVKRIIPFVTMIAHNFNFWDRIERYFRPGS
jgi:hypothetical protein